MVNPRWRPTIANSRSTSKTKLKDDRIDEFDLPKPEPYIGRYIDADIVPNFVDYRRSQHIWN